MKTIGIHWTLLAASLLLLSGCAGSGEPAREAGSNFAAGLLNEEYGDAYNLLSPQLQKEMSVQQFIDSFGNEELKWGGGLKPGGDETWGVTKLNDGQPLEAKYYVKLTCRKGEVWLYTALKLTGGKWVVTDYRLGRLKDLPGGDSAAWSLNDRSPYFPQNR